MEKMKKFFSDWSFLEIAWLIFVCTFMTVVWFINGDTPFMLILSLTGSLNLVLGAKGKIAGLYFAIINSALYSLQCYGIPLYGEVMYNVFFSIPVSLSAIFLWKRNMSKDGNVKFRTMSPKLIMGVVIVTLAGVFGYMQILEMLGGSLPFMDSLTTVVAVIASLLYVARFSEQWLMWVIVNILSITMWVIVYINGDHTALLIIVMKTVNMLNSLYGYVNWKKNSLPAEEKQ